MTPEEHYKQAFACMRLIDEHKNDEAFDKISAQTLAQCAMAEAMLGILQVLLSSSLHAT